MNKLDVMVGEVPTKIVVSADEISLDFESGASAKFFHTQDCCESVEIEDVTGDWHDLIGETILVAEERSQEDLSPSWNDSGTWTFYTFRTNAGTVDVRWYGSSNGYYSESVDFSWTSAPDAPAFQKSEFSAGTYDAASKARAKQ